MKERNDDMVRVAVIGAGALAGMRIYPYLAAAGGRLVASCDLVSDRAEAMVARYGGVAYTSAEAMLDSADTDAVIACVGPTEHPKLARLALDRGLPVYTEKPPAETANEAQLVAEVAEAAGLLCVTALKKRYARAYRRARSWIDGHADVQSLVLRVSAASGPTPRRRALHGDRELFALPHRRGANDCRLARPSYLRRRGR